MKSRLLKITLLLASFYCWQTTNAQTFEWAKSFGGSSGDRGYSIAVDESGNIYTTGFYEGTVDFDPGEGVSNLTSVGSVDVFVQKTDANGNFIWAKSMGGYQTDISNTIYVDTDGYIYISGRFQGTADFDPGNETTNLISAGIYDIFVQKMDTDGNFIWARSFGGGWHDECRSIAVDADGNVFTTGLFNGTADFDPGTGTTSLTSNGFIDYFIQKMDADGNFVWAKSMGGTSNDYGQSISLDASGNIYTTGVFYGVVDFDPGQEVANLTSNSIDIFIHKMDNDGNFIWAKSINGSSNEFANAICNDADGNVYITGYFSKTSDFNPGEETFNLTSEEFNSIFVLKLDNDGNFTWVKSMGGTSHANGFDICLDASENIYTTGYYYGTVDFDPTEGTSNITSSGSGDIFVQKMDSDGNFIWAKSMGGSSEDYGISICIDASENIYTTGYFIGTSDFDPNEGTKNLTSSEIDIFIQKMSQKEITAISETKKESNFIAYPNPTTGNIQLVLNNTQLTGNETIEVKNVLGKVVYQTTFTKDQTSLDLNHQENGIYFITITSESGDTNTLKVIKQ